MSERLIRSAKESYVHDLISLEEFEQQVWGAITGARPSNALVSVLKEAWTQDLLATTDAPGSVMAYDLH